MKKVAASVRQLLLNEARATGRPFNETFQYFAMERFLYRLSKSPHGEKFVLKGELMEPCERTNRTKFRNHVVRPLLEGGLLEMTIPDEPTSSRQRYRTAEAGETAPLGVAMARRRRDELEQAMQEALAPGAFIGYRDSWAFVEDVEAVRGKIAPLIRKGEAPRAVGLFETFIAGCYEKSEEIDDSSGSFGTFVEGLFCDWIRACQAAKADPDETAETLLSWMEDDDYGYCHRLEEAAVKAFGRAGLAAFERAVRLRMAGQEQPSYPHRRSVGMLKAVFTKRRDVQAYADLCEEEDDLAPKDCETLAEMCLKRRRSEDALAWVERGLELEKKDRWPNRSAWRLPQLRRAILKTLGRAGDALASAWEDYRRAPSLYSYEDLMEFVPKGKRAEWHARAIATLDGADLSSRIELLVKTRERDRLAEVIESAAREDLMVLSHYTTEPVVKKLGRSHPLLVARLRIAMGLRIVEAKKSKYYDAALGHFEKARDILTRQEQAGEWEDLVAEVRERHGRKYSFMPGFERLVEGYRSADEPSFLDRARKKWESKTRGRSSGRTR